MTSIEVGDHNQADATHGESAGAGAAGAADLATAWGAAAGAVFCDHAAVDVSSATALAKIRPVVIRIELPAGY